LKIKFVLITIFGVSEEIRKKVFETTRIKGKKVCSTEIFPVLRKDFLKKTRFYFAKIISNELLVGPRRVFQVRTQDFIQLYVLMFCG